MITTERVADDNVLLIQHDNGKASAPTADAIKPANQVRCDRHPDGDDGRLQNSF